MQRHLRGAGVPALLAVVIGCSGPVEEAVAPPAPKPTPAALAKPDASWLEKVKGAVLAGEYRIRPEGARFDGYNRQNGLRVSWEKGAAAVLSTTQTKKGALSLRATGFGRGETVGALPGADFALGGCRSDGATDETNTCLKRLERSLGDVVEYWENRPAGLEQGFIVAKAPKSGAGGRGASVLTGDWLRVDVSVTGGKATVDANGLGATIVTATKQTFRYAGLVAWDADKRQLPARMRAMAGGLRLEVDDSGAKYPVTIDPVLTAQSGPWVVESNDAVASGGTNINVGSAGDVNGDGYDDVFVAFPFYNAAAGADSGRVLVFHSSASGPDTTADWDQSGTAAMSLYGNSASRAGDVNNDGFGDFLVGEPRFTNTIALEGRVAVYLGSGTGLSTTPTNLVGGFGGTARLGQSVSTAGDIDGDGFDDIVAGMSGYDDGATLNVGRVLVFKGSAGGIVTTPSDTITGTVASQALGTTVAGGIDVNADGRDDVFAAAAQGSTGTIYGFYGVGDGTVSDTASWTSPTGATNDLLTALAVAGDVNGDGYGDIIAGALGAGGNNGAAYIWYGSATGLPMPSTPSVTITGTNASRLGKSVGGAGDINGDGFADVVVGAYLNPIAGMEAGIALVYLGSATGTATTQATADQQIEGTGAIRQGTFVAGAGDVNGDGYSDVIIGAERYTNGQTNEGGAFLYLGSPERNGVRALPNATFESDVASAALGTVLANVGDVNGDGFDDFAAATSTGTVTVYHGAANGPSSTASATLTAAGAGDFGAAIAGGDTNGDGYSDVVVGAPGYDGGETDEGRVYVYLGSASGVGSTPTTFENNVAGSRLGAGVGAGDLNADGRFEVLAGAPGFSDGEAGEGRVYALIGRGTGPDTTTPVFRDSNTAGAGLGNAVAAAGDVNGDGFGDVVAGASAYSNGETAEGRLYVFLGAATGLDATATPYTAESNLTNARMGTSVASAGDVSGDGFADVVVGTPAWASGAQTFEGRVSVYPGSGSGFGTPWHYEPDTSSIQLGASVAGGDLNGDGYGDVVAGAPEVNEGRVVIFLGSGTGLPVTPSSTVTPTGVGSRWGASVALSDINGSTTSDLLIGGPGYANGSAAEGGISIHFGNVNGRAFRVRAQPAAGSLNAQRGGVATGSTDSYRVTAQMISHKGRVSGRLEVEARPVGTAFTGTPNSVDATSTDTGTGGVSLSRTISGLAMRSAHHFRARFLFDAADQRIARRTPWYYGGVLGYPAGVGVRLDGVLQGGMCTSAADCGSGFCVDGVCCNAACGGTSTTDCQACSIAAGATVDGTCASRAVGTSCSDANACTTGDTCTAGGMCGGTTVTCTAMSQCHDVGTCDTLTGMCSNPLKANGSSCSDGSACTTGETCTAGVCGGGTGATCPAADQCHDAGTCNPMTGMCVTPPKADGTTCSDGNACSTGDTCQAGTCTPAGTVTCTAMSACHDVGVCDTVTGMCSNPAKANGSSCSDGSLCTTGDTCQAGTCSGTAVTCTAMSQCHDAGTCDPGTGMCSNPAKADGSSCTDGNACTTADTCVAGTCTAGTAVTCTPLSQCHDIGTCDTATGTCSNPLKATGASCNDGNMCTTGDTCNAGTCTAGTPVTCTAMSQCHDVGVCNPATGTCSNPVKANGTSCSGSNMCNSNLSCQAGVCTPGATVTCAAPDQCHDPGTCDTTTGTCTYPNKPDGTTCNDNNPCTTTDSCQAGVCTGSTPVTCTAMSQCHEVGSCDTTTGVCSNPPKANGTACDDGNMCTVSDSCTTGSCTPGAPRVCNDDNPCTADSCVAATGCVYMPIPGCPAPTDGGTPDADAGGPDADAGPDAVDVPSEVRPDVPADMTTEVRPDVPADMMTEVRPDVTTEVRPDVPGDVTAEVRPDTTPDTVVPADARVDIRTDAPVAVGGGGGCDCDVGKRNGANPWQSALLFGLGLFWLVRRRRSRK